MSDLTRVLQRKRAEIDKLQKEVEILSAAEALLMYEAESASEPADTGFQKRVAQGNSSAAPAAKPERVVSRFP